MNFFLYLLNIHIFLISALVQAMFFLMSSKEKNRELKLSKKDKELVRSSAGKILSSTRRKVLILSLYARVNDQLQSWVLVYLHILVLDPKTKSKHDEYEVILIKQTSSSEFHFYPGTEGPQ
jgi:hypothetical protein